MKRKRRNILIFIILIVGLIATLILVRQRQDIRQRAAESVKDNHPCDSFGWGSGECMDYVRYIESDEYLQRLEEGRRYLESDEYLQWLEESQLGADRIEPELNPPESWLESWWNDFTDFFR